MAERVKLINPNCVVEVINEFVDGTNASSVRELFEGTGVRMSDAVLDCVDDTQTKAAIISTCLGRSIPVVTCGASGGLVDPTKVVVRDIGVVGNDMLLRNVRKSLRDAGMFERGPDNGAKAARNGMWGVRSVTSTEQVPNKKDKSKDTKGRIHKCDDVYGSVCWVTATFGMVASWAGVECIAEKAQSS
jgi:tRNA A37 threonylcarbamoyladenosine dehydratase